MTGPGDRPSGVTAKPPFPTAPARRAWVEQIMGMPISIHLRGAEVDGERAERAVAQAFAVLREMDAIFSTYRDDSDLMRLRREEVPVSQCSPLLEEALAIGQQAEAVTRGAFTTLLPTGDGDLAFDPTGLVKGWAVDRASAPLVELEGISFCISAGGDVLVGAHPDLPTAGPAAITWRVGVEDPRDRQRIGHTLTLVRGAVATSGTAARGAHLYDPVVGAMIGRPGSVTVTGPTLLWADIWATALFVGSAETRAAFELEAAGYSATEL
ncbi:FAD:protein FMN transferase [Terrabacter sp. NPDC080008]|uniref:FAD:protein FMN transferase n=1 Tax=Terrabacter sp. NPDC080008 TaxID=3155176 RepID=UPI00344DB1FB